MKFTKNNLLQIYYSICILTMLFNVSFQLSKCSTYPKVFGSKSEEVDINQIDVSGDYLAISGG